MFRDMSTQMIATLAEQTRLKEDEGLLLAVHPDFILVVRAGMDRDERNITADARRGTVPSGNGGPYG